MQMQTRSPKSKFPDKHSGVISIQIDQHLKKLLQKEVIEKIKRGPDFMNHSV